MTIIKHHVTTPFNHLQVKADKTKDTPLWFVLRTAYPSFGGLFKIIIYYI